MQVYHNNYYIDTVQRRMIALICVLCAVLHLRGVHNAPRYTAPENGDLAGLQDSFSQGVLREHVSRRNDPPDLLLSMLLFVKLRQLIFAARPQSGHNDRFYIQFFEHLGNENEDVPSAILRKFENFMNPTESKETQLKGANHENNG